MKKRNLLILFLGIFLLASIFSAHSFVSAAGQSTSLCCEKTTSGAWCQNVASQSQCAPGTTVATTSCAQTSFCQLGTCVNTNSGVCSSNVGKQECSAQGGQWYNKPLASVPSCTPGCCKVGNEVSFVSQTECKQLATDYGVSVNFLSSVTDEQSCLALAKPTSKGACITGSVGDKSCTMTQKQDCQAKGGTFHDGLLCTAPDLNTSCAKSAKTMCYDNSVYFLDTCGNIANIYDPQYDPVANKNNWGVKQEEYWTNVKSGTDYNNLSLQGKCDYNAGTTCSTNSKGVNYCKSLSCNVEIGGVKQVKQQGESWCAQTNGTLSNINVDPETMAYEGNQRQVLTTDYNKYNTPGSRYVKLTCWDGKVLPEPCADYRNEICKQADIGTTSTGKPFTIAQCRANTWRQCLDITNKQACEDPSLDCTWLPGARFDGQQSAALLLNDSQGSCLPLYPPGFNFWNSTSQGSAVCNLGSVTTTVSYESSWLSSDRNKIPVDAPTAYSRCYGNCYAIPGYANGVSNTTVKNIYLNDASFKPSNYPTLSSRLGAYCENKTGSVTVAEALNLGGSFIPCTSLGYQPLFYTNKDYMKFLTERAALLGDCGYKTNFVGTPGQNSSEIMTEIYQKLNQQGQPTKNYTQKTIYQGDAWTTADPRTKSAETFNQPVQSNPFGLGNLQ